MTETSAAASNDTAPPPPINITVDASDDATVTSGNSGTVLEERFCSVDLRVEYGPYDSTDQACNKEAVMKAHLLLIKAISSAFPKNVRICNGAGHLMRSKRIQKITDSKFEEVWGTPHRTEFGTSGKSKFTMIIQTQSVTGLRAIKRNEKVRKVLLNHKPIYMRTHHFHIDTLEISLDGLIVGLPTEYYSSQHAFAKVSEHLKKKRCNAKVHVYPKYTKLSTGTSKRTGSIEVFAVESAFADREAVREALTEFHVTEGNARFFSSEYIIPRATKNQKTEINKALHSQAKRQEKLAFYRCKMPVDEFNAIRNEITGLDGVLDIDNNNYLLSRGIYKIIILGQNKRDKIIKAINRLRKSDDDDSDSDSSSAESDGSQSLHDWSTMQDHITAEAELPEDQKTPFQPTEASVPKQIVTDEVQPQTPSTTTHSSQPQPNQWDSFTSLADLLREQQSTLSATLNEIVKRQSAVEEHIGLNTSGTPGRNPTPSSAPAPPAPAPATATQSEPDYRSLLAESRADLAKAMARTNQLEAMLKAMEVTDDIPPNEINEPPSSQEKEPTTEQGPRKKPKTATNNASDFH